MGTRSDTTLRRWMWVVLAPMLAWTVAATETRGADEPLVVGVFPRYNAAQNTTMYTPLADYLGRKLGRKVTLVTSKDFASFWEGVKERRYDIVHYNQYHYIQSVQDYQVIAVNKEFGKDAVAGALFVRKSSGITKVSQLRGRTIVFGGGKDAMMSYIAPRYLLLQAGLKEGDFKSEFAVNPPNAVLALYYEKADAAGGGDILISLPVVKNAINEQELTLLAKTEPLRFLPWAVKRTISPNLREAIKSALLDLERDESGKAVMKSAKITGLGAASDKDYDPHRKMVTAVFGKDGIPK